MSTISAFSMGALYLSSGIHLACSEHDRFHHFIMHCIHRHHSCDWGELDPEDFASNQSALSTGGRLFSAFDVPQDLISIHRRVWIITEHDRNTTTVLLPREY
ncbi:MAG: hypothetical protein IPI60_05500 [Saprospiraceae bacterium]|nr:hypothetical protein [Saprospiraceae bacterium]